MGDDHKVAAKWTKYAQDIYRRVCAELVFLDMGAQGVSNEVRSSKLAWLRKRLDGMEPEQVAHVIRPLLQQHRRDLDAITAAWLPHVSESFGPSITMHTGLHCPSRTKSSDCQLDSSCSSFSYMSSIPIIQPTFCCMEVLKPYQASTVNYSSSIGSCNQSRDTIFCSFQNKASPFRSRRPTLPTSQRREGDNDHERFAPDVLQGHGHCFQPVMSLPGPDSRGGSEATRPARCTKRDKKQQQLLKAPVDVRVGGTVGQQPPEARQCVHYDPYKHTNHFDHISKKRDPEGTTFVGRPALQEPTNVYSSTIQTCRQPSKGSFNHRPIPPSALAGTMIVLLALLITPVPKQAPELRWQVTRIVRGTYRRRLSSVKGRPSQKQPKHRRSASTRPSSGRLLGVFILLLLC